MAYDQNPIPALYKKLLHLYPRGFRQQLGESMEQTFNDLYNEEQQQPGRRFLTLSIFTETAIGIVREHLLLIREGVVMKNILVNPRSAAIASLLLSLPLGLTYVVLMFDLEPLAKLLNNWFTIPGQQGQINTLGRIVVFGGLLVLPIAFALNLQSMLKRMGPEGRRKLHTLNLIIGTIIFLLIILTWGSLILEQIYCLQGIRCD
jgi:hypothetical protein